MSALYLPRRTQRSGVISARSGVVAGRPSNGHTALVHWTRPRGTCVLDARLRSLRLLCAGFGVALALFGLALVVQTGAAGAVVSTACTPASPTTVTAPQGATIKAQGTNGGGCYGRVAPAPGTLRRIARIVAEQSASLGEHHPRDVGVVYSTRRAATTLTGSIENEDTPIYFVQARGHFKCSTCSVSTANVSGRFFTLGLATTDLQVVDFGIGPSAVRLNSLGHVYKLKST